MVENKRNIQRCDNNILVLYQHLESKHQDIPFEADLGEPGTPYIDEVGTARGKTLDVIQEVDNNLPADRNSKYSLKRGKTSINRKELCERLCGKSRNHGLQVHIPTASEEPPPLLAYSKYRALASAPRSDPTDENARSGFEEEGDVE